MVETRRSSASKRPSTSQPASTSAHPPKCPKVEPPASPMASSPGRADEVAVAVRSTGSTEDALTAGKKDQGGDKPAAAVAESSRRRKEPTQLQHAVPWAASERCRTRAAASAR